jgi:cytochrome d ubiquinol oxidase subunit I
MRSFDPVFLSRIQFAWVIGWHILLPAFNVGAASFIAVVEGLSFATGREVYARISVFWTKIFAIAFGMGVVTGIVMPFHLRGRYGRARHIILLFLDPGGQQLDADAGRLRSPQ